MWFSRSRWSLSAASTTVAALPGACCPPEWRWKMPPPLLATWAWLRRKTSGQRSLVCFLASRSHSRTRKCGQWSRTPRHRPQPRPRTGPRGQPNGWVSLSHRREGATPLLSLFLGLSSAAAVTIRGLFTSLLLWSHSFPLQSVTNKSLI